MKVRAILVTTILTVTTTIIQSPANASSFAGLNIRVRGNIDGNFSSLPPYSDTINFFGTCLSDVVPNVNFDWGGGGPAYCPSDFFTTYFYGYIKSPVTGTVNFYEVADDGFYLEIGGQSVISDWELQGFDNPNGSGSIALQQNQVYPIRIWHYEYGGGAGVKLFWNTSKNDFSSAVIVPNSALATDSSYWGVTEICGYKGNSLNAKNAIGSAKSASPATSKSNGVGVCQNAASR